MAAGDGWLLPALGGLLAFVVGRALSGWGRRVCDSSSGWLRGWVVGLVSGMLAAAALVATGSWWEVAPFWLFAVACGLLICCDWAVQRLPDPIMAVTYPAFLLPLALAAGATAQWSRLGTALLGGLALLAFYLASALLFPTGIYLGDVKFAGVLGVWLGWFGWQTVLLGTLAAAILSGIFGLVLIVSRRGGLKSEYAYGPMMAVGAWAAVLLVA